MDICVYKNNIICAFDVTNINEVLNYEIAAQWREAGKNGLLRCPECGNEVHLKAKDLKKKVPHFAHKIKCSCSFGENTSRESEEHKKGKLKLYHYFRNMYGDAQISISKNFSNKRRIDLYIEFKSGEKLAVEFQRTDLDKSEWKIRHDFYKDNDISDLWIINGCEHKVLENTKQLSLSFFEQIMLNEHKKIAVYFDIIDLKFCISKNIRYIDKHIVGNDSEILFSKSYNIEDIKIMTDGNIDCSFYQEYEKAAERYLGQKEKESLELVRLQNEKLEIEKMFSENESKDEEIQKTRETIGELIKNNNQKMLPRQNKYTIEQFSPGTMISHRSFGKAEVKEISGNWVTIKYGRGQTHTISLNNCLRGIIVNIIEE